MDAGTSDSIVLVNESIFETCVFRVAPVASPALFWESSTAFIWLTRLSRVTDTCLHPGLDFHGPPQFGCEYFQGI